MTVSAMIQLVCLVLVGIVLYGSFKVMKSKNPFIVPTIKILLIALILFGYLVVVSLFYRHFNADSNLSVLLRFSKSIAKSIHFAANALTSASLVDSTGYTGDVLRWMERMEAWWAYYPTGIIITIAPLFSAAWLVSLLNKGLLERLYFWTWPSTECWIFYDSSDQSIRFAEELKKHLKKEEKQFIVFCRTNIYGDDIAEKDINRIRNITNMIFDEDETSLLFRQKNHRLVICAENGADIQKYIDSNYHYPQYAKELIVVSNDFKENLVSCIDNLKGINPTYLSFKDMIAQKTKDEIKTKQVFMIHDNEMGNILNDEELNIKKYSDAQNYQTVYAYFIGKQYTEITVVLATEKQELIRTYINTCEKIVKNAKVMGTERSIKIIVISENYNNENVELGDGLALVKIGTHKELLEEGVKKLFTQQAASK